MKLFLVSRDVVRCPEEFDAFVVAARDEKQAQALCRGYAGWRKAVLTTTMIGPAKRGTKEGIILGSFNGRT